MRANFEQVFTIGMHNALTSDGLVEDIPTSLTFVSSDSDLTSLDPKPGDFAATYGLASFWQYDGTEWQAV